MKRTWNHLFWSLILGFQLTMFLCCGQTLTTGTFVGTLRDPSDAAVVKAPVEATNTGTNRTTRVVTDENGDYVIANLPVGFYSVTVSASGFQPHSVTAIKLDAGQTARVDMKLELGTTATSVDVTAVPTAVQSESSLVGSMVEGPQVTALPLNGRTTIYSLLALAPGVQNAGNNAVIGGNGFQGAVNFSVDGVSNNDPENGSGQSAFPSLEAIQEFRVISNGSPAEYGRGGAQVIVVTKSGSNQFHGSAFYFNRNNKTTARNFFAKTLPPAPFNRNEFGGSAGGRIWRDRTFFFSAAEMLTLRQPITASSVFPTASMRSGDFTGLAAIRDPLSGLPFSDNKISAGRISSISSRLQEFIPATNTAGTGPAGTGTNYFTNNPFRENLPRFSQRIDHLIGEKDTLSGSFILFNDGPYFRGQGSGNERFGNYAGYGLRQRTVQLTETHTFSPVFVNELRLGYQYDHVFRTPQNNDFDPSSIIPGLGKPAFGGVPGVNITGFSPIRDQSGSGDKLYTYQLVDNVTWVHRSHIVKLGFQGGFYKAFNFQNPGPSRGAFNFTGRYSGNAYADFLLGYLNDASRNSPQIGANFGNHAYAFYLQDDWKVSQHLTLNLGLRYDYYTPFRERDNKVASWDPVTNKLVTYSGSDQFPVGSIPRLLQTLPIATAQSLGYEDYAQTNRKNFGPRIGFAYRPFGDNRNVVRAFYGIVYNVEAATNGPFAIAFNAPFVVQETFEAAAGATPTLLFSNPFPGSGNIPSSLGVSGMQRNRRSPMSQQWNFTVEREVARNTVASIAYVGNHTTHISKDSSNFNDPIPGPGTAQPNRPFQPWGSVNLVTGNGDSIAHQLQAGARRRFLESLSFEAQYQYTRALSDSRNIGVNPYEYIGNGRRDRGNSDFVRTQVLVANSLWELPFGKGKSIGSSWGGAVNSIFGGWQLTGIFTAASGLPFSVTYSSPNVGFPNSGRADVIGDPAVSNRSTARWFNPAAFAAPAPFTFGSSARNMLWGPGLWNIDFGTFKNIAVTERFRFQFRSEFFNLFNHANLGQPSSNISVPSTVASITSTSTAARQIQFGLRLDF